MEFVKEPARKVPLRGTYDTIVVGAGIAGISAALASARHGAKTLLIEREYLLGGLATSGLIAIYLPLCDGCGRQVSFGIAEELLRFSIRHGTDAGKLPAAWLSGDPALRQQRVDGRFLVQYNPQVFAAEAEELLSESRVSVLFGSCVCAAVTDKDRITHLLVENKSGRGAYAAKTVVDATGDADIVHLCGENESLFGQGNLLAAWYYAVENGEYRLHQLGACDRPDGETELSRPEYLSVRRFGGLSAQELTEQVMLGHRTAIADFLHNGDITAAHTVATLPTIPQIRMTRRLNGTRVMDASEMHTEFPDSVGLFSDWRKRGPVYELPFSVLHGNRIANLICAGRNISVTDALWDITRVIPVCAVSGEAAGTAAALYSDFRTADLSALRKALSENGVRLHETEL